MERHFVTFFWPGSFVANTSVKPISGWDVKAARQMAGEFDHPPYGFRFSTRSRGEHDLDSSETATSGFYYLGGTVETADEIERRGDPRDRILLQNMRCNDWPKIIRTRGGWAQPLNSTDVVLP
jgi:hypothetical protein